MVSKQQSLKWKGQTPGRDAVDRVKRGDKVKNDTHVRKLIQDTAEARYYPQGKLKDLSLGAVVTLALSFTAAEWAAVNRDPALLQETLDYFKTGDFQIDRWWTYWRNLQLDQPKLAKLFLLEIIYEYWKDDITYLIDGVKHISNGLSVGNLIQYRSNEPVPKRRKANSKRALPLKNTPDKGSEFSNAVPKFDAETVSSVTGSRPGSQSARPQHAENGKAVDVPCQLPVNNHAPESHSTTHGVHERQISGAVPDTLMLEQTGTISALLNHDHTTAVNGPPATTKSVQGSKDCPVHGIAGQRSLYEAKACATQSELSLGSTSILQQANTAPAGPVTPLLKAIRFEKHVLQKVIRERPNDILGGIWFGSLPGYPPFISLRLPRALNAFVRPFCQEVYIPEPPQDASSTVTGTYLIKLVVFRQMIQRDGFGEIFWNDCGEEAFVTMLVVDEGLAADFIRHAQT